MCGPDGNAYDRPGSARPSDHVITTSKFVPMARTLLLPLALLLAFSTQAQTHFYIDEITVTPPAPTTADNVSIQLIGNLSDGGAYIQSVVADVSGFTVEISMVALSNGGITVLIPHTENIILGQLPAGTYTIYFTDATTGVLDSAPLEQHEFTVTGGNGCDNLDLVSVQWHAFTDSLMMVHVQNNGPILFDYPNFILFDAMGDTLAKETVNFFGIPNESWHPMQVMDGATIPEDPFPGTLELWTLFTTELACTWELDVDLCPPGPCATMIPYVQNMGGGITTGTFDWALYEDGDEVASGQFELTNAAQYDSDTICLPPGRYDMNVVPNQPLTGGQPMYGVYVQGFFSSATQEVYGQLPVLLPIDFYLPCTDISTGLIEQAPSTLTTTPVPGGLMVHRPDGAPLGALWLFDAQGRLLVSEQVPTDRLFVPVTTPGVYLLRAGQHVVKVLGGVW